MSLVHTIEFVVANAPNIHFNSSTVIPEEYKPYLSAFADAQLLSSSKADILIHRYESSGSSIINAIFFVREKTILETQLRHSFHVCSCMIQGTAEASIKGLEKTLLYQGQFNLLEIKPDKLILYFEPGIYEWQGFTFSRKQIGDLASLSPMLNKWLLLIDGLKSAIVGRHAGIIQEEMGNRIREIKRGSIPGKLKALWVQHKVFEVLIWVVSYFEGEQQSDVANNDFLLFAGIKSYIDQNLDIPHTVAELAHMYNISESRIKKGFSKYYQIPISKYLIKQRMETAERLVRESGLSMNKIAYMLGYGYPANFTREYKKYHGKPPGGAR
ncbi:helix-turn-helix transcriptional regulator [Chitinophaga qingshengii]|uniref:Helix-turn-helix transcriptional regulator n=1 Tax=Chitinophaga qingshengii TaxID=1569794 RepID=A0ABR7TFL7_9BACT|nr:AraC family transcriptional regulator [Chitinophaga qingshengii]MBC9929104.1 helix-turn-helix transcriptional regulator [Chitinophaga qingshengii]